MLITVLFAATSIVAGVSAGALKKSTSVRGVHRAFKYIQERGDDSYDTSTDSSPTYTYSPSSTNNKYPKSSSTSTYYPSETTTYPYYSEETSSYSSDYPIYSSDHSSYPTGYSSSSTDYDSSTYPYYPEVTKSSYSSYSSSSMAPSYTDMPYDHLPEYIDEEHSNAAYYGDYQYGGPSGYIYRKGDPTEYYYPSSDTSSPCLIVSRIIDNQDLENCTIIASKIVNSRLANSLVLESDVHASRLTGCALTASRVVEASRLDRSGMQFSTVEDSELELVAGQAVRVARGYGKSVALQAAFIRDFAAQEALLQGVRVVDGKYAASQVQLADVRGGEWSRAALTLTTLSRVTVRNADIQNCQISDSTITEANVQDSLDKGDNVITNSSIQTPRKA